jgi:hypothetical protein
VDGTEIDVASAVPAGRTWELRSLGPDGALDTEDDIVLSW